MAEAKDDQTLDLHLPWRWIDIGEILNAEDDVMLSDVPEDLGEAICAAMNRTWQPMDTIPTNGTPVLLRSPEGHIGLGVVEERDSYEGTGNTYLISHQAWTGSRPHRGSGVWLGGLEAHKASAWMPAP